MIRFPILRVVVIAILLIGDAPAQESGGRSQQAPGLAMVKPQVWSKNNEATVMEFTAFEDRTAVGNSAAGYYEFRSKSGQDRQLPAGRVVKLVVYPDVSRIPDLVEAGDRNRVEAIIRELQKVVTDFPSTKSYLAPGIAGLSEVISKFDAGEVKVQGVWLARSEFDKARATKLAAQLRSEIQAANPPGSFDLANDPKYPLLEEMAEVDPALKSLVDGVLAAHRTGARKDRRRQVVEQLANPSTEVATCRELVKELKGLEADGDAASKQTLAKWERAIEEFDKLEASAATLGADLEAALAKAEGKPDAAPGEVLVLRIETLQKGLQQFQSDGVGRQLTAGNTKASDVAVVGGAFVALPGLEKSRDLFKAKALLDSAAPLASVVGPATEQALAARQKAISGQIETFTMRRDEGKAHEDAGRKDEALVKYREALAISNDPGLEASVERLGGGGSKPE